MAGSGIDAVVEEIFVENQAVLLSFAFPAHIQRAVPGMLGLLPQGLTPFKPKSVKEGRYGFPQPRLLPFHAVVFDKR